MKTHKEDIDMVKSVLETQNKSVVESLENLQNQIDGTKEHMENKMTEMMEKVEEVEKQIKAVENDATKTSEKIKEVFIKMITLESGMTKTNERVEGVDSQLNVFYNELKENSKYSVSIINISLLLLAAFFGVFLNKNYYRELLPGKF